uniref:Acetyl-CoA hydrolase n=1 Tax=Setaria digitata TaxID=48799 RepID=A0A915Q889_9BILA
MNLLSRFVPVSSRTFHTNATLSRRIPGSFESHECGYPIAGKTTKIVANITDAFNKIKSGDNIFVHGMAATPTPLLDGLCEFAEANDLKKLTLHHLHLEGPIKWTASPYKDRFRSNSLFTGANLRKAVNEGVADFNSVFLHEVPLLFRSGSIKLNVALIMVSPPDSFGYCTLGTSVDASRAAITQADHIIAISNKSMPRTFGDSVIHQSHIDVMIEMDFPLHQRHANDDLTPEERKIGKIIAENLVDNGSTLQMGIGAIPDAALSSLTNHKDLGIHTEMLSDGVLKLVDCNAITNSKKTIFPGKIVTSFAYGTDKLYHFVNDNPSVFFGDVAWINDPTTIRMMPKMVAINSAVEIDLTGQVVSDSVGNRFLSGFGGQVDFIRGAAIANDGLGKPIIAILSATKKGQSKIVPYLNEVSFFISNDTLIT